MKPLDDTYAHILETMHDGVLALSDCGEVMLFNKAASGILGIRPEDALGRPLMEILNAEDARNDEFSQAVLSAVFRKGENLRLGAPYVRPDGKELYLDVATSYRLQDDGGFNGVVMVFTDITELRLQYDKEKELTAQLSEAYRDLEGETASMHVKMHRSKLSRRLGLGIVAVVLLAAGVFLFQRFSPLGGNGRNEATSLPGFTLDVESRPVTMKVSLTGRFDPLSIVNVVSPFNGRVLEKRFSFGRNVAKGDLLLELDTSELMVKLREAESAYIKAQQEFESVDSWDKGLEVSNARRVFVKAKKSLDTAREKMEAGKDLLERGIIPQDEYDSLLTSYENLELDFSSAQEQLGAVLDKGSDENVLMARMAMKNARFNYESLKEKIALARVTAPVAGLIIRPSSDANGKAKAVEVGTSFSEGDILLAVGNTEGFTVTTKADEVDMVKLRTGQPVAITGEAFQGMVFPGVIKSISSQAESSSSSVQQRSANFEVVVQVDELTPVQRERIKLGMMATMEVTVYDNPSAIVAPLEAVHIRDGRHYVTVVTGQGPEEREVVVGMTTLDAVEIRDGLEPGEQVLVVPF